MNEMIPAWKNDKLVPIDKLEVHRLGLKHPAISIFIKQGEKILLQQRASFKYHSPDLWANSVCTHPHWGESSDACATRRLSEELGISALNLDFRSEIEYRAKVGNGLTEHELVSVFVAEVSEDLDLYVNPNPSEVRSVKWIDLKGLRQELKKFPSQFTEWLKIYINQYSNDIFVST